MKQSWEIDRCEECGAMLGVNFDNRTVKVRCAKCEHVTQLDPTGEARRLAEELNYEVQHNGPGWIDLPWQTEEHRESGYWEWLDRRKR